MAATVSIEIVVDDKDLQASAQRLPKQIGQIEPALQKVGQQGNVVLTRLAKDHERARDAASLLSRTLGVELPRQLEKFLASSKLVGPALAGAFNVAVIGGFVFAIGSLVATQLPALVDWIKGVTDYTKKQDEAFRQAGISATAQFISITEGERRLAGVLSQTNALERRRKELIDDRFKSSFALVASLLDLSKIEKELIALGEKDVAIKERLKELRDQEVASGKAFIDAKANLRKQIELIGKSEEEQIEIERRFAQEELASAGSVTGLTEEERLRTEVLSDLVDQLAATRQKQQEYNREREAQAIAEKDVAEMVERTQKAQAARDETTRQRIALEKEAEAHLRSLEDKETDLTGQETEADRRRIAALNEIGIVNRETAAAMLPPWLRADEEIILSAERRAEEIRQSTGVTLEDQRLAAAQTAHVWVEAYAQMRDRLAGSLEGLFDDITSGNIGRRFLDNFKRLIFQLVAQWILGVNRMRAASAFGFGGGGGILASLFGGLLGIPLGGGGGGGGGLFGGLFGSSAAPGGGLSLGGLPIGPSTAGQAGGLNLLSLLTPGGAGGVLNLGGGLSAGGGVTSALSLPAGASFGSRLAAGLGGLIPSGLLGLSGLVGFGGPGQGLLSGLLGAAGLGGLFAVSTGAGFGVGALPSLAAFFSSALGAATLGIGAVVGLLFGILGGGKKKRERERLEGQLIREVQKIEEAYKQHQLDFDTTIGQLEQLRAQFVDAQKQVGGGPVRRVHRHVDAAEREIRAIEDERKRRQEVVFGPAEFHRGGIVASHLALTSPGRPGARAFHSGDVVNANLLVGESVLNQGATGRLGKAGVQALNSGQGLRPIQIVINAIDPPSFQAWLRRGGGKEILSFLRLAASEGGF